MSAPKVAVIMGSVSDADVADKAIEVLEEFEVSYEVGIKSAHRTPNEMLTYAEGLADRGVQIVIALAGGSAHLPGMVASSTSVPVLAVPVRRSQRGHGDEAMKSSIAMPPGIPLAVFGDNAADRAALFAVRVLGLKDDDLNKRYQQSQQEMADAVVAQDQSVAELGWKEFRNN